MWLRAEKSEAHNPDGLLVTVELASSARPITVKIHTLLEGGPVMVRWLEVTNTGKTATAITAVSPRSGLVWDTTTYQERLPKGMPGRRACSSDCGWKSKASAAPRSCGGNIPIGC